MSSKLGWGARLVCQNARRFTTSEKRFVSKEAVEKLKKKQEFFQARSNEDEPVHMISSKTHFYITSTLGVLTVICAIDSIYKLINSRS